MLPSFAFAQTATDTPGINPQRGKDGLRGLAEQRKNLRQDIREKRRETIERFREKKQEFKERLLGIRDERRRAIVERVSDRIDSMNERYVDLFSQALDRLQLILDEIDGQILTLESTGLDTGEVKNAANSAQSAINVAKAALSAQAGKEYVIQIATDEVVLKASVGKTMSQFRRDIRDLHKKVVDARQAVKNAARVLKLILIEGRKLPGNATQSGGLAQ